MIAFFRRLLRSRREQDYLIRNHSLLVDEALAAHRAGAELAMVQNIYVGGHRRTVQGTATRLDLESTR